MLNVGVRFKYILALCHMSLLMSTSSDSVSARPWLSFEDL